MTDSPEHKKPRKPEELEKFDELFPQLVNDLTKQGLKEDEISSAIEWFKKVSSQSFNITLNDTLHYMKSCKC